MPNHVTNRLTIIGSPSRIHELLRMSDYNYSRGRHAGGKVFNFEAFVPMPDTVFKGSLSMEDKKKYPGDLNWYDWSINHWGTKWNAYDISIEHNGREAVITFDTAWSPPHPVIGKMAKIFSDLSVVHEFIDEGWGFVGETRYEEGVQVSVKEEHGDTEYTREMAIELCEWEPEEDEE